jgi:hypothetical protein
VKKDKLEKLLKSNMKNIPSLDFTARIKTGRGE